MSVRERIIEESMAMFLKYGLKGVRMDDIATTLGVSKRTIYEIFGDKENLIETAIKDFYTKKHCKDMERTAGAENIIEKLLIGLSNAEESIQQSLPLMNDLKRFYPKIHLRIHEESYDKGMQGVREAISIGINQGLFLDNIGTEIPAALFVDLIQTVHHRIFSSVATAQQIAESMRYCLLLFVRGISTHKGIQQIDNYLAEKL